MWFPYLLLAIAYLLGSFPTGYLIGKMAGIDIRQHGSGSTGATNVWRNIGKLAGITVFVVDFAKGAIAIYLMQSANSIQSLLLGQSATNIDPLNLSIFVISAGMLALLGHSRPVWLGFKGGKCVATGVGILFMLNWVAALCALSIWAITLGIWSTVSISSIAAAASAPIFMWTMQTNITYSIFVTVGCSFVIWLHRSNIERILNGTELSFKSKSKV